MSDKQISGLARFLSGKGFYVALAACLATAGTAAYMAMDSDTPYMPNPSPITQSEAATDYLATPSLEDVAGSQKGVKVEEEPKNEQASSQSEEVAAEAATPAEDVSVTDEKLTFITPIDGSVFTPFSNGELIKSETLGDWRTHNGIDIEAPNGTPVKSAFKGTVTTVKSDALWGYVVEVTHKDGIVAIYCGLTKAPTVKEGDQVAAGQVIGAVGYLPAEGLMPEHLHFECKENGKYIDPLTYLK